MSAAAEFPQLLEGFFTEWLATAIKASDNTVASYRDAFSLFVRWAADELGKEPDGVSTADVTSDNVLAFLKYLEETRGNGPKTVNCRLAALKSFCGYAAYRRPDLLGQLKAIRDLPQRRERRREVSYLTPEEAGWMIAACPGGSESELLLSLLYNTGARISELLGLHARDVTIGDGGRCRAHLLGKGRKERTLPLWDDVSELLKAHIQQGALESGDFLFAGRNVEHLTRSGARHRIEAAHAAACAEHPELATKHVTPHTFRHSCAMAMLAAGVDIATVAIWLGHESVNTTHRYVVSDMRLMEDALSKVRRQWSVIGRKPYKASEDVLEFLRSL